MAFSLVLQNGRRGSTTSGSDSPVGKKAGPWEVVDWINSRPLQLSELDGKVVLVRWWTGPGCPYCSTTAPALQEFHQSLGEEGLQVIGFYHHKSGRPLERKKVRELADGFGFTFPVAVDPGWQTLRKWWLDDYGAGWTSVSFLIDRSGMIRYVHPGGSYPLEGPAYKQMRGRIVDLLGE